MLENIIYGMPFVLSAICVLLIVLFQMLDKSTKSYWKISTFCLLGCFFFDVVFYNKSVFEQYLRADYYTLFFKGILYITSLFSLFLARRWYATMATSGIMFCVGLLLIQMSAGIIVSSVNLALTFGAIGAFVFGNYIMLRHSEVKKATNFISSIYVLGALFFLAALLCSAIVLYADKASLNYEDLREYFLTNRLAFGSLSLVVIIILSIGYVFGFSPFHFWFTEAMGQMILPVFAYFILIFPIAAFALLGSLNLNVFIFYHQQLGIVYQIMAAVSMMVGAVGACSGKNLHKIMAYSALFNMGLMLSMVQNFSTASMGNMAIYLVIYLLTMYGILSAMFGLKSNGEYVFMLSDLSGAASKKSYICAMLTAYLFSLIGFPPFLGFFATFNTMKDLLNNHHLYLILILLSAWIVLMCAYLQIIRTLYFAKSNITYDRTERGIYGFLLINALSMVALWFFLEIFVVNIRFMMEAVFV